MPTVVGHLIGATFQTELLVMNLLGLVNSLRKWELDWTNQVDAIRSSEHLGEVIKIILCWIVKTRIIIQPIYTITYLANFYAILTWCCGKTLLPWMIVSAFDNFLLEFIAFVITLLLWTAKSISDTLFIEYMIFKAISQVPAVYYWRIIKLFRADLHENLRRKLTHQSAFRIADVNEHIRFGGVSYNKDHSEKSPRFASLTNLDDFSLHSSSFKFDDEQDSHKRSKSLLTVLSIDSLESDDPDEYRILHILDDNSLTPTEKAMKILNINDSDIHETRMRLGKSILSGPSKVERTEYNAILPIKQSIVDITSTKLSGTDSSIAPNGTTQNETTDNVVMSEETTSGVVTSVGNIEKSTEHETMVIKSDDDKIASKVRLHDKIHAGNVLKISSLTPLSGCVCRRADDGSLKPNIAERDDDGIESSDESHGCQGDDDDCSGDMTEMKQSSNESEETLIEETTPSTFLVNSMNPEWSDHLESVPTMHTSQQLPLKSMPFQTFLEKENEGLTDRLEYSEDMKMANYQLFRVDDITAEVSERHGNPKNIPDPNEIIDEPPARATLNDIRRSGKGDTQSIDKDCPTGSADTPISMQTDISDLWENSLTHDEDTPDVAIDGESYGLPITHFSHLNIPDRLSNTGKIFCRFSKTKKQWEKINDPESREMKALRVYNKLTLLEDRREMEAKKKKSSFSNWIGVQDLIYTSDLTNHPIRELREFGKSLTDDTKEYRTRRKKLDHMRKSQNRSRPRENNLKLSAFHVQIDALKASISSRFSDDKKSRYRSQNENKNSHNTTARSNEDAMKQLSKYSKPMNFQEDKNMPYQDHGIVEVQKNENGADKIPSSITHRRSLKNIFPKTILTSANDAEIRHNATTEMVCPTVTIEELRDRKRLSTLREAIMSIDWSFNGQDSNETNFVPPNESFDWRHENFLWDILDETNTVTLLQSAFSSNSENTSRGFYLGPGSTELYYVSNCLDGVVEEIMKTAKLRVRNDAFTIPSTSEIDYGDSYLQEFTITDIKTSQDIFEDTLTDSDSGTSETLPDHETASFTVTQPEDFNWNGYSTKSFRGQANDGIQKKLIEVKDILLEEEEENIEWKYLQEWASKSKEIKSLTDILGHQELSHLEYWTRELKKLASNNHRSDSSEFTRHIQHLTALPGFCVVQKVMDFFRHFVAVSRSTMTSTVSLTRNDNELSISSSSNDMTSQLNVPLVIETSNDCPNMKPLNDDFDCSAQFYFGTPDDRHFLTNEILPSTSKEEDHGFKSDGNEESDSWQLIKTNVIPEEIQAYPLINESTTAGKRGHDFRDLFATSSIIESSSQLRNSDATLQNNEHLFQTDPSVDSYDSLYSPAGNSKCSNNTVSIGCHSSMEEFSLDPTNVTESRRGTLQSTTHAEINH